MKSPQGKPRPFVFPQLACFILFWIVFSSLRVLTYRAHTQIVALITVL